MPWIENACTPTIDEMLEAIRREPTSPEANETAWALWRRVMGDVEAHIARMRPPALHADPQDFRLKVLEDVEGKFLPYAAEIRSASALPGLLKLIAKRAFIDAIRRHKVHHRDHVPLPDPEDAKHQPEGSDPFFGASSEPDAEFGESRVDPALSAELQERSVKILGVLQTFGSRSEHSLRVAKAVLWRIIEGRPRFEVAEALGISERQVDRDLAEGKAALKELLSEMTPVRSVVEV